MYEKIIFTSKEQEEKYTPEQKEIVLEMIRRHTESLESLCVIYHPDCGCPIEQMVVLDRYPMSPKIISTCPSCSKGCLMEISNPIRFYLPLLKQDYELKDLKDMVITKETRQTPYFLLYQEEAISNSFS